jgi:hypothetical protein
MHQLSLFRKDTSFLQKMHKGSKMKCEDLPPSSSSHPPFLILSIPMFLTNPNNSKESDQPKTESERVVEVCTWTFGIPAAKFLIFNG